MKTIKFYTLGCKVNQYDTQSIREQFIQTGFQELEDSQPADIYIINTCTVTHRADSDSFCFIRKAKKENPQAKIIVTGCLTELDADKIKRIESEAIIIKKGLSPSNNLGPVPFGDRPFYTKGTVPEIGISYFKGHTRAFLKIQDGCNNFCSYCKVPLVRGCSRSRPLNEIIPEAGQLVRNGHKEIVLCGICLGAYGKDLHPKIGLAQVIGALEKIEGPLRIRLSSIDAPDVTDELIDRMANSKKLCPHLHIPLQSADDEILKKMNRNYTKAGYLSLINEIKTKIPQIAITTDVLVGFPGESEANFQNTVELIKEILPLKVHIFPYSRRAGTLAAKNFKDEIGPIVAKERISRLKNIAATCALIYKKQFLGKDMSVLIETQVKDNPEFWEGHTDNYIKVRVGSKFDLKNQLIHLKINKIGQDCVYADFC